jgi:hypothetical protein
MTTLKPSPYASGGEHKTSASTMTHKETVAVSAGLAHPSIAFPDGR